MSAVWWAIIAIVAIFLVIVVSRLTVKLKQKSKQPKAEKPKKEKVVKEKKEKQPKAEKEPKAPKEKKEKHSSEFIRPTDVAWAKLREKQKLEKERKEELAKERAAMHTLGEGESDNPNFVDEDNKEEEKVIPDKPQGLTTEKTSELAEEIKELSPEMKALLFGDVLDKKTK